MTDLDKQVAQAQGWTLSDKVPGGRGAIAWYCGDVRVCPQSDYTPSTDLNQAVAFAEWVCGQMMCGYDIDRYDEDPCDSGKYRVRVGGYARWSEDNLAEAICQAVLKALGERKD